MTFVCCRKTMRTETFGARSPPSTARRRILAGIKIKIEKKRLSYKKHIFHRRLGSKNKTTTLHPGEQKNVYIFKTTLHVC